MASNRFAGRRGRARGRGVRRSSWRLIKGGLGAALATLLLGSAPAAAAPPANDAFANAQALAAASVAGTTVGATYEPGEPDYSQKQVYGSGSVWYSWTAPSSDIFLFATCGSSEDNRVFAYIGSTLAGLSDHFGYFDHLNLGTSETCHSGENGDTADFKATAGTTYHIAVVDRFVYQGPFQLTVADLGPAPVLDSRLTTQSAPRRVVKTGHTVTYTTTLRNTGNRSSGESELDLVATKPRYVEAPAKKLSVVRIRTTRGSCKRWPRVYRGAVCKIPSLAPGEQAVVRVTLRLRQSITYWASSGSLGSKDNLVNTRVIR